MDGRIIGRMALALVAVAVFSGMMKDRSATPTARATATVARNASDEGSPIFGVTIPKGYRDWKLISVTQEEGNFNQLRAVVGNDIAVKAYREGKLPFPDGSIIVALHWKRVASDEDNKAFGKVQASVAGPFVNLQVMVKDSKKYASTGGWGFGDFVDGKPSDKGMHETCFPCHEPYKASDYVFTHYAP